MRLTGCIWFKEDVMVDLKSRPFFLDEADSKWVEDTLRRMTPDEKAGQVFLELGTLDEKDLKERILENHAGAVLFRPGRAEALQDAIRFLQDRTDIPLLCAGNTEEGGIGIIKEGTYFAKEMGISATSRPEEHAYRNGLITGRESTAIGCNWSFGPSVDMNIDWRSPITNVNSYGTDFGQALRNAQAFIKGAAKSGVACAPKHFPGEGYDDRDQHFMPELNEMSCEEWSASFGKIFKGLTDGGVLTLMPGHIALPAFQKKYQPDFQDHKEALPCELSPAIMTDLLRGELGFAGVAVSDNTCIGGFSNAMARAEAIPRMIAAGCDMIMYSFDFKEDIGYLKEGLAGGLVTEERLDEAVTRILAVKAALGLHKKKKAGTLVPGGEALRVIGCPEHAAWSAECAEEAVTLVKDTQHLLPVTPEKYKKILLEFVCDSWKQPELEKFFTEKLTASGFDVHVFRPEEEEKDRSIRAYKDRYDLIFYVGCVDTPHKDKSVLRINWSETRNVPGRVRDVPALYLSLANPYDLVDVPVIKTYINGYSCNLFAMEAAVGKIMGKSTFKGKSPVDPFCGRWDAAL